MKDYIAIKDYSKYNLVEPVVKPINMTLDEVSAELGRASKEFYMSKMKSLNSMSTKKREFMIKVMHIITTSSYLSSVMKGEMPLEVKRMLEMALNFKAS